LFSQASACLASSTVSSENNNIVLTTSTSTVSTAQSTINNNDDDNNNLITSSSSNDNKIDTTTSTKQQLFSDEVLVEFMDQELGIAITETSYKGFPVVSISRISADSHLAATEPDLRIGAVITQVGSNKVDGLPLREIGALIKASSERPLSIKFRDPSR